MMKASSVHWSEFVSFSKEVHTEEYVPLYCNVLAKTSLVNWENTDYKCNTIKTLF